MNVNEGGDSCLTSASVILDTEDDDECAVGIPLFFFNARYKLEQIIYLY